MQQDVRQMMSPRLEAVKLTIQHVRNGGKRMPVVSMHMGEGPLHPVEAKTAPDSRISENIGIVIVVDELVPQSLAKNDPDNCHQENRDDACDEATVSARR